MWSSLSNPIRQSITQLTSSIKVFTQVVITSTMQFHFQPASAISHDWEPMIETSERDLRKTSAAAEKTAERPTASCPPERRTATVITTLPTNEPASLSIQWYKLASLSLATTQNAPEDNVVATFSRPPARINFQRSSRLPTRLVGNA